MPVLHPRLLEITEQIIQRSVVSRNKYLDFIHRQQAAMSLKHLSCANVAHAMVTLPNEQQKKWLETYAPSSAELNKPVNVGIITAYNDMLSAHKPYEHYPEIIRQQLALLNASAQVAGGVPAMCDGITQGQPGMELSLFSRDVIAQATGVALSHSVFNGVICLGICDKIVPGLLIGALRFGHLPVLFLPSGPMPSGLSHSKKAELRKQQVQGNVTSRQLLAAEHQCYHTQGTCTFYGTANTNQLMLEFMGLHLPGASFVNPDSSEREQFNQTALVCLIESIRTTPKILGEWINEKALVNAIVGILATGGSTNHTIHLLAIAKAAGIQLTWDDFQQLSEITPLLARIYPNGTADVNEFHQAGGVRFIQQELLSAGLLHADVMNWLKPELKNFSPNLDIVRPVAQAFSDQGGLRILKGNLGQCVVKVSALNKNYWQFQAPAKIFISQEAILQAYQQGLLSQDCVIVLRFQGPRANGMPELHKLVPIITVLMDKGHRIALLTDGRLSGASGKILAAIHCSPEAIAGGPLAQLQDGDKIELNIETGQLNVLLDDAIWKKRIPMTQSMLEMEQWGYGRELFECFRSQVSSADEGATVFRFDA